MNYSNLLKRSFLIGMLASAATACQEDVNIGNVQAPDVTGSGDAMLYVADANGSTGHSNLEFRNSADIDFYVNTTAANQASENVTFTYDPSVLEQYNKANNTEFEAVPASMVTLSNGGSATLAAGETQSAPVTLTLTSDGSLDAETTYAVPLRVSSTGNLATMSQSRIVFVKDLTAIPDCHKTWIDANGEVHEGIKIFSCMEVNDTNPLNNLSFTLKKSGKYLIDAVILFSANINYDSKSGRVYVYCNPNVQHLLDNREKYLKPLQDRGMKVILGILGNHDRAAIDNLADETARLFAQECKGLIDAYNLDGVFLDDEYSATISPAPAGFVEPSRDAASRLCYELDRAMPDKLVVVYVLGGTYKLNPVDGKQPGEYIDYGLHDYGQHNDLESHYPGLPKSGMGMYSQEFARAHWAEYSELRSMRDNGYGAHMIFAMDPNRGNTNVQRQLNALQNCASAFYDDDMVFDGIKYPKDW